MIIVSRICFWGLLLLALLYAGQLAHVTVTALVTDPPACKISYNTLLPSPLCPGLNWDQHTRFMLSLPGAYLSYPIEIGLRSTNLLVLANPQFVLIMLLHIFGWGYAIVTCAGWLRRPASTRIKRQR